MQKAVNINPNPTIYRNNIGSTWVIRTKELTCEEQYPTKLEYIEKMSIARQTTAQLAESDVLTMGRNVLPRPGRSTADTHTYLKIARLTTVVLNHHWLELAKKEFGREKQGETSR